MKICHCQEGCISNVWGSCSIIHGQESMGVERMLQNGDEISVQWVLDLKTAFLFFMIFSWPVLLHVLLTHPDIFRFSNLRTCRIIGYFCNTCSAFWWWKGVCSPEQCWFISLPSVPLCTCKLCILVCRSAAVSHHSLSSHRFLEIFLVWWAVYHCWCAEKGSYTVGHDWEQICLILHWVWMQTQSRCRNFVAGLDPPKHPVLSAGQRDSCSQPSPSSSTVFAHIPILDRVNCMTLPEVNQGAHVIFIF